VEGACATCDFTRVVDGRFRGGYTTRHYGRPLEGVHAIQMELACRGYMADPEPLDAAAWPSPYDPAVAAPMRAALTRVVEGALDAARALAGRRSAA
jgi:formiminoglutamase